MHIMNRGIRHSLVVLLVVFLSSFSLMAQKKKVALLPIIIDGAACISTSEKNILNSSLRNSISSSHRYEALTRTDFSSILKEYDFQASGFVDDQQRVEIGGMSGADYICLPKLTKDGAFCYLEVSLIEVSSGLIASAASCFFKNENGLSMDKWDQAMRDIVADLMRYENEVKIDDSSQSHDSLIDIVNGEAIPFQLVESKPSFMGGTANAFVEWVNERLVYPDIAQKNGVQGRVTIQFIVEADGSVTNVKVLRGVDASLDKEAVRVVSSSPKWKPGMQRDRAVKVTYAILLNFNLI